MHATADHVTPPSRIGLIPLVNISRSRILHPTPTNAVVIRNLLDRFNTLDKEYPNTLIRLKSSKVLATARQRNPSTNSGKAAATFERMLWGARFAPWLSLLWAHIRQSMTSSCNKYQHNDPREFNDHGKFPAG